MNNKIISKSTLDRIKNAMLRRKKRSIIMGKYFNKTGKFMNLQVTRFDTISVKAGFGEYDDKIAKKFPAIFEPVVEDEKIVETGIEDEKIVESGIEDEDEKIVESGIEDEKIVETGIEDEKIVESGIEDEDDEPQINYEEMEHVALKELIKERNLNIDGRASKAKCIEFLRENE